MGIINMNGRIYDPNLHCFLQPDNNIQDPFNTQNYNRYGYVLNNPLKYTDPSGEFINVFLGYLLSGYIMGAYASGGELNPAKWNSSAFITIGAAGASAGASAVATNLTNNYLDNYNKPPVLGFSAVGSGNDMHSFVNNNNDFNFKNHPNNTYQVTKNSGLNGNLATIGSLLGGVSGLMNELSIVKFHNAAPAGSFAVNYNGSLRYWSDTFKGGTKAGIPSSVVQAARNSSNGLKFASKLGGIASTAGTYIGYYGAVENFLKDDYYGFVREGTANYVGTKIAATKGNIAGIGWTIGWNILGPWVTNTQIYNSLFFGENSSVYRERAIINGWYESKIFKD
ncbi:RHS repeat-associated core domain-containing protein [Flavobacterium circumlabens]|uniref:RHS repeat-associated core domain-containing protein n=1 Tax=Flavobacterium circumlabens TaxID=2133765 RepID=UPI003D65024F